jgi:hypothetical protein
LAAKFGSGFWPRDSVARLPGDGLKKPADAACFAAQLTIQMCLSMSE